MAIREDVFQICWATGWAARLAERGVIGPEWPQKLRSWQVGEDELPILNAMLRAFEETSQTEKITHTDAIYYRQIVEYADKTRDERTYLDHLYATEPGYWDEIEAEERAFTRG